MGSTTSKRLRRVWALRDAVEGSLGHAVRLVDLDAALEGGEAWKAIVAKWEDPFPWLPGQTITQDVEEWLDLAPEGTVVEALGAEGGPSTMWRRIPRTAHSPALLWRKVGAPRDHLLSSGQVAASATVVVFQIPARDLYEHSTDVRSFPK